MDNNKSIAMRLGETVKVKFTVVNPDGSPADLSGATGVFAISEGVLSDKAVSIVGNVCTVTISPSDIDEVGTFNFEFRVRDSLGQVDSLVVGDIVVAKKFTSTM